MTSDDLADAPLQDYPERSVWTTWAISYQAIRERHEHTANLLLLWSFLDNKDLWYGLFAAACRKSAVAARMLSGWIGNVASSEIKFSKAMQLLCNYSLVEKMQETGSYATHPVVHQWAYHSQGTRFVAELNRLAVVAVGHAVPASSTRDYAALQRRLLLHAQACSRQVVKRRTVWGRRAENGSDGDVDEDQERKTVLDAVHLLGDLFADQGRLGEAEQMYERALRGYEALSGVRVQQYLPALNTLQNMGDLYATQAESAKARAMYTRALSGLSSVLGASSERCIGLAAKIDALPSASREREGHSNLPAVSNGLHRASAKRKRVQDC
jgi:tetratricopeptide (TPR) repeat protein